MSKKFNGFFVFFNIFFVIMHATGLSQTGYAGIFIAIHLVCGAASFLCFKRASLARAGLILIVRSSYRLNDRLTKINSQNG